MFGRCFLFYLLIISGLNTQAQSPLSKPILLDSPIETLYHAFDKIQQVTPVGYSKNVIGNQKVSIAAGNWTVKSLINELLSQTQLKYVLQDQVILFTNEVRLYTISGTISDNETGENLVGAAVVHRNTGQGTTTNNYGFFSLSLPQGNYELTIQYVGYEVQLKQINLGANHQFNWKLQPQIAAMEELVIIDKPADDNLINTLPGRTTLRISPEWNIPYFLGEAEIFQNSLLEPGIRSLGEQGNGLSVRGGDIDQNQVLLDESTIYNPNHFFGLISVFNPEAIKSVQILKGYMPAKFGGRVSSIIDIVQKEGNNQEFAASGGIGLISARLTAEGPLQKNRASYLVSARRSLLNFPVENLINDDLDENRFIFFDINAKVNWRANDRNQFYITGYQGLDRNRAGFNTVSRWGNRSLSARWNHVFGPKLFGNLTALLTEYNYQIEDPVEVGSFIGKSRLSNLSIKSDFTWDETPNHRISFGGFATLHTLRPGERRPFSENTSTNLTVLDTEQAIEGALYLSHQTDFSARWSIDYGLRLSGLWQFGPKTLFKYAPGLPRTDASIIDSTLTAARKVFHRELNWEPRLSFRYRINDRTALKASYHRVFQYIHLISNTVARAPTDIWKLTDPYIEPTHVDHYTAGFYRNFLNNKWESSLELYYKNIYNVIDFKDGADLTFRENLETELLNGRASSFGLELLIRRNVGKLKGWLSYTWSFGLQEFDGPFKELQINDGQLFATNFDKRHDINLVGSWQLSDRTSLSSTFTYNTGRPFTLPNGKFRFDDKIVPTFGERNGSRLPDYHRLDLSLRLSGKRKNQQDQLKKVQSFWIFTVYNVYSRKNIFSYFFLEDPVGSGQTAVEAYSVFGSIIPAVTYNFKF